MQLRAGSHGAARVWPTGFDLLDLYLNGGFRPGQLILLGGQQGLGKTAFALQMARHAAVSGRSVVYFTFEHDAQTMLERLIAMEAGSVAGSMGVGVGQVRKIFETNDGQALTIAERIAETKGGVEALDAVQSYADRLLVHESSGSRTSTATLRQVLEDVRADTGQLPFVVVDHLQKMRVPDGTTVEDERVTTVVEELKDIALEHNVPVLAVVTADKEGLAGGKRMRVQNMRGSAALAYEADTVLIMNNKFDVIARHHLVYNVANADRFHDWVVVSIEKNRHGADKVDLEFRKQLDQSRFHPDGQQVAEQLIDERMYVD